MTPMDVVILCGGKGTRLQSVVSDRPKPMASVSNKPFIELLIEYISGFGFGRFILCAGYMGDVIERHFAKVTDGLEVEVLREAEPLDTAGAVKNAEARIKTGNFVVLNGDSICKVDMREFAAFHLSKKARASLVVTKAEEGGSFGSITKDGSGAVLSFREKTVSGTGYVNAGVYIFDKSVLGVIPAGVRYSMERDLFPALAAGGGVYAYEAAGSFLDIGTPDGYRKAGEKLK